MDINTVKWFAVLILLKRHSSDLVLHLKLDPAFSIMQLLDPPLSLKPKQRNLGKPQSSTPHDEYTVLCLKLVEWPFKFNSKYYPETFYSLADSLIN